jgi:hypothetical protein
VLDEYCERLGPGLWAEPLNTVTNLSFLLAAWAVWRLARDPGRRDGMLLAGLLAVVGAGSTLYHTFATPLTRALDLIPILIFQLVFLGLYARRVIGAGPWVTAAGLIVFLSAALSGRAAPEVLNGSLIYAPALLVLTAIGIYHLQRARREPALMLAAAGVFVVSVTARTLDNALCGAWPYGTHFVWHLLNGVLLYLVARAYLGNAGRT